MSIRLPLSCFCIKLSNALVFPDPDGPVIKILYDHFLSLSSLSPVYFNSATKTVINCDKYMLDKSFQEILYRIDNWINEGSGWMIESIEAQYVNISVYSPLSGSTYIELPDKLKNPMKGLINIKNNENVFFGVKFRHFNLVKTHPERIMKEDKNMINDLNYEVIKFPVSKKIIAELKDKTIFVSMCFVVKMD